MAHALPPELSLGGLYPQVAESWDKDKNDPLSPFDVRPRSNKKLWWRCAQGHSWQAVVSTRTGGSGCPYCAGRKPTPQRNLLIAFPQIAAEWHPVRNGVVKPSEITPKSNGLVWWRCTEGHEWPSKVSNRTVLGQGCPFCAGNRPPTTTISKCYTRIFSANGIGKEMAPFSRLNCLLRAARRSGGSADTAMSGRRRLLQGLEERDALTVRLIRQGWSFGSLRSCRLLSTMSNGVAKLMV